MESVDSNPPYPKATFTESLPYGYIYAGMKVDPPSHAPFVRRSAKRDDALKECKALARQFETLGKVVKATVYEAVLIPPIEGIPRFDVILLIQTISPEAIMAVETSQPYERMNADFVMAARNTRRIGDTEKTLSGTFLFNHFTAEDPVAAVEAWENLTGWYTSKTGVDNSTLLQPIGEAPYAFVNYVRLPHGPVRFLFDQFTKPSFYTFVRTTLRANDMVPLPLLCKPV